MEPAWKSLGEDWEQDCRGGGSVGSPKEVMEDSGGEVGVGGGVSE